jgi:2-dehydro-3-deoxygalactonokinase
VDAGNRVTGAEVYSEEGIAETYMQWQAAGKPETERIPFYTNLLAASISRLPVHIDKNIPILISGMVSSSIGLAELPYQDFPFTWNSSKFVVKKIEGLENFPHPLFIISGFKTENDVMRGEETLLLGCEVEDDGEKIFIFPGTHSKHVFVKNKKSFDFKTYMTGEIFNLLAEKSILRNAVKKGMDEESFAEGFKAGMEQNILHHIFLVRTRQLLKHANPVSNYQYLSGLLIGTELRDLRGNNFPVYLVCSENLKQTYLSGLALIGFNRKIYWLDADVMLIKGQCKIADHFL